ncbi:MAG: ABC transporter permease, partial [Clostridia bacterium]|nr:ABC transporter permease [Clostridia bacterium]
MHKLTINRFAWKNLYKNSKRYLLMAFGVLLSMVFSSGTLFFVSCLSASRRELIRMEYSQANNIAYGVPKEGLQDLDAQKPEVEYGLAHVVGFGYTDDREKGAGIAWMDALARELYYPVILEGRLPEKEGEIAAERDALLRMGLDSLSVGETFTLNVDTPDGEAWLPEAERITYTLVGILGDKRCNIEMYFQSSRYAPALLVCPDTKTAPGGREALTAYIRYPDDYEEAFWLNHVTDGCTDGGGPSYGVSENVSRLTENAVFTAVFTGVLTLVSALGIVNAFSSDLSERKKQIGMLRAVGATKGQIVRIYGRESLFLCLLCAPVSAALSYFGVKLLTRTIENFVFIPSWGVLLGSVGAGVAFVLLASLIPLAAAARISPMQAIRNTELSRKQRRMRIRSRRRFSVPGLLAKRNLRFYRGRTVLTSLILAVTI